MRRREFVTLLAGAAAGSVGWPFGAKAELLNKIVHVIVGFPAGGGTDIIARVLADRIRVPFASSVIVENKPGAAARASVDFVKNAEPDGRTLLFTGT